jgi:SAM-dependent methyltransferase
MARPAEGAAPVGRRMSDSPRHCPACGTGPQLATLFLEESIDASRLSALSFASRKAPEYMSYHLVRCTKCDLVYADHPPSADVLAAAYHAAAFDSAQEADDAAEAYIRAAKAMLAELPRRQSALEIGTGTGAFLERLRREGFCELVGIEPSRAAIEAAPAPRRAWIREGMFEERDWPTASFDLVCCFMTLEHVRDPAAIAEAALRLLRPGGAFVAVTHDYRSSVNRLLGKRSPIVDIEHMQLFSRASVRHLFEAAGFDRVAVTAFTNRYRASYWLRLMPLPHAAKAGLAWIFAATGFDRVRIGLNVGNLFVTGFRRG